MNRTTWLQDRRMQKFRDVLSRWESAGNRHGVFRRESGSGCWSSIASVTGAGT